MNRFDELINKYFVVPAQQENVQKPGRANFQRQGLTEKGKIKKMSKKDECEENWICKQGTYFLAYPDFCFLLVIFRLCPLKYSLGSILFGKLNLN